MTTTLVNASKHDGVTVLEARMDESVHVLMLTGAGDKFFCAGADIKMLEGESLFQV